MVKEIELREEKSGFVFVYRMKKQNKKHHNGKFIDENLKTKESNVRFQFFILFAKFLSI